MHLLNLRTYFNFPLMDISVRIFFKVCPILHYFVCLRGSKQPVVAVVTWRRPVVFPPQTIRKIVFRMRATSQPKPKQRHKGWVDLLDR